MFKTIFKYSNGERFFPSPDGPDWVDISYSQWNKKFEMMGSALRLAISESMLLKTTKHFHNEK